MDYSVQNEEWIAKYQKVQRDLEESSIELEKENADNVDTNDKHQWLLNLAFATRVGRAGVLQSALQDHQSRQQHHDKNNHDAVLPHCSVRRLFEQSLDEMDRDAALQLQQQWKLSAGPEMTPACDNEKGDFQPCTDIDVDAFFEEYPECMKCTWDQLCRDAYENTSNSDLDEGGDTTEPRSQRRSKKEPRTNGAATNEFPSSSLPPPEKHGGETNRDPSHQQQSRPNNPYHKKNHQHQQYQEKTNTNEQQRPPTVGTFPYTPVESEPTEISSTRLDHTHRDWPFSSSSHRSTSITTEREEHERRRRQQQQNPFQTAREASLRMENGEQNRPPSPQNHQYNSSSWNNYQHQPQLASNTHQQNNINHPYQSSNPPLQRLHQPGDDEQVAMSFRGGPSIPDSLKRKFQPPKRVAEGIKRPSGPAPASKGGVQLTRPSSSSKKSDGNKKNSDGDGGGDKEEEDELPDELKHLDKELVKKIENEIMEAGDSVTFDDIAGLEDAKQTVKEVVCWPMKRPDLFTGLRRAPNGLLLYGPPGTGKTLIGKAIAHESGATFFSISSSSLTSKWIGEGEKLVKTLFAVAAYREPAVVFIDEIDSLLTQRQSTENEASRRIKTEFLVQLDGTGTTVQGLVLIIGATNRPQELDEAARRRFTKRLYIPLPDTSDRNELLKVLLKKNNHQLTKEEIERVAKETEGFSGADLKALCTDAAMGPIRQLGPKALEVDIQDVPPISFKHFKRSLKGTKPSVDPSDLTQYEAWDKKYGSKRANEEDDTDDDNN